MGQPNVSTTEEGMGAARAEFEQKTQLYTQQLSSVNSEMANLQTTWQGTASINFNTAMDSWEQGFQRVITALMSMIESMGGNVKEYAAQEDDASALANNFASVRPGGVSDTPAPAPAGGLPGL